MVNLLSNAVRYSPKNGRIVLGAGQENGNVVFWVQDFGKGIEPGYQARIFERYFRVPGQGDNMPGTGLGLAISKEFITAQGGSLWVESALGEGSTFTFNLPISAPDSTIAKLSG
jgi:signal transduction histidine kinase